jgi:hypothetical protein
MASCRSTPPDARSSAVPPGSATASRLGPLDLDRPPPEGSRFATSPVWRAALSGDALDLDRLARSEGAAGLAEALDLGGQPARSALAAAGYAEDGELLAGRLCALAAATAPPARASVLRAVRAVWARPRGSVEHLDATAAKSCEGILQSLVAAPDLDAAERDLASSARAALNDARISR